MYIYIYNMYTYNTHILSSRIAGVRTSIPQVFCISGHPDVEERIVKDGSGHLES